MENDNVKKEWPKWIQILISILLSILMGGGTAFFVSDQMVTQGTTNFDTIVLSQDLTVGDDLTIESDLRFAAQTTISLTMNATLTPVGTYQPIEAAGNVSAGGITVGTAGDVLNIINTADVTIVFTDTGTLMLSGDTSLGQYDTLTLWCDGTNWIEIAQANN